MVRKLNISPLSLLGVFTLLVLLVLVRVFQEQLFYDPFIAFFRNESKIVPPINKLKLFGSLLFRYGLNTILSLGILYLLFRDISLLKLTSFLYCILFAVLATALYVIVLQEEPNLLALFYIRRFIIQPLFLFLFLPALYFQKNVK